MRFLLRAVLVLLGCWLAACANSWSRSQAAELSFNRDIRPILSQACFTCHGVDAKQRKADLRLDLPEAALAEREGTFAIKPGDPGQSQVWVRLNSEDPGEMMPPPASRKQVTPEQKAILRRWIQEGAVYQKHWSFEPPQATPEPAVKDMAWPRGPVDRFILARLEAQGLKPQPEADKETLIRRVAFTLTGLPPTLAEVDQFLPDASAGSYEAMVDRYLASPHFGEEMARHWLDVARYADTHGMHLDNERQMWAYRDWVVQAFNDNLPFDQFTVWQLAGDLLPSPTPAQLIATGFNRCNVTSGEGGAIDEEMRFRYAVERASTTLQTWLGLTGGCAVCHDHKYDPLTTKEFYSFYAFFNSAADPGLDGNINDTAPFVKLPRGDQQAALDAARRQEDAAHRDLLQAATSAAYQDPAQQPAGAKQPVVDVIFDDAFPPGAIVKNTSRNASDWIDRPAFGAPSGHRVLRQENAHFHEEILESPLRPVTIPAGAMCDVWLRVDPDSPAEAVALVLNTPAGKRRAVWGDETAFDGEAAAAGAAKHMGPLPASGHWTRLTVTLAELDLKEGQQVRSLALQETGGVVYWDALTVLGSLAPASDPLASLTAWWKGIGKTAPAGVPEKLCEVVTGGPDGKATAEQKAELRAFYLAEVARPIDDALAARRRTWEQARAARAAADYAITGTLVYRDQATPRDAFVMLRGQYDKPGEKVAPAVPAVFPPLNPPQEGGRLNRLDLARWLVSAQHPLTARVEANRLWQQIFGTGLVKTSGDFGTQGELPSHPELLDWLAIRLRESGWDVKQLVRLLVTSAAFRQQSHLTPAVRQLDPENRLLASGPRMRLDAEQIRDNALFVSGLIDLASGGRGVRPYQPPNIWEPVGYANSNTRYYLQDHGSSLYRRSLYVFYKRTAPAPFLTNFDAPNREQFCARRERSDTPLQALQLMNDVQQFEAARRLAERAVREGGSTTAERIAFLYRTVLARRPSDEESRLVFGAFETQRKLFEADPAAARKAIHVGESAPAQVASDVETAAWTLTANLLLNLDETINRN